MMETCDARSSASQQKMGLPVLIERASLTWPPTSTAYSMVFTERFSTVRTSRALFGGYLHHNPHFGANTEAAIQQLQTAFQRTLELWAASFDGHQPHGAAPECCTAWPEPPK